LLAKKQALIVVYFSYIVYTFTKGDRKVTAKRTMTLNLTEAEMAVLEELCIEKDMSKTAVLKQALRLYQLINSRKNLGDKLFLENDIAKEKKELVVL
jgi:hypothetical protein